MDMKVPVTLRAILQRINRKLADDDKRLKKTRERRWLHALGPFYVLNVDRNRVEQTHVDPVELARALGVMTAWEEVVSDENTAALHTREV